MNIELFVLLFSVVINLLLGVMVLTRGLSEVSSKYFFLFTLFISTWTVTNYLTDFANTVALNDLFARLAYATVFLAIYFFFLFAKNFPSKRKIHNLERIILVAILFIGVAFSMSSFVVDHVELVNYGVHLNLGPLYVVYIIGLITLMWLIIVSLLKTRKEHIGTIVQQQVNLMIFGTVLSFVLAVLTNAIIPAISDDWRVAKIGPLLTVFLVTSVAVAIIKHQLFNIRLFVARSLAYGLLLATMTGVYLLIIITTSSFFLENSGVKLSLGQILFFIAISLILILAFQPLKRFFDRLTDKIFYRQSYKSEEILTEYSDFLVDEVDTDRIINYTLSIVNNALNPEISYIVLYRNGTGEWYNSDGIILEDTGVAAVARALEYQKPSILTGDPSSIRDDEFAKNIKGHMDERGLRLSVKLSTHGQLEGFILLGDKKNGSRYNPDDHKFLITVANEVSVSLQSSERFEEIQKFNKTLKEQIEAATKQLRASNKKLQTLDQAKDEFISMASHQLRTPLTSVKGYVSMILDGDAGPVTEDQKKLLSEAFASSQRMVYLISDLLNVSRLKTGKFIIEKTSVSLPKIVEQEVNQLIPAAQSRNLVLSYAPPTRFPELMLDETKTRQVIMNFIDNAIYYTKSSGQIEITLQATKDHIEYRVKDTGIGVPTRDQHKLFTKFFRAHNARSARPDGTGLGLYMAQKIITAQGGTIYFESKEGKGSVFGFNLPLTGNEITGEKSDK